MAGEDPKAKTPSKVPEAGLIGCLQLGAADALAGSERYPSDRSTQDQKASQ